MDRISFVAMLLLALGLCLQPLLHGDRSGPPAANASAIESPIGPAPVDLAAETHEVAPPTPVRGVEGFWRLGKSEEGVWWFLSPDNKPEFLNTVTTVQPYQFGRDKHGIHYVSRDWDGQIGGEGNLEEWAEKTIARIQNAGFKGLGAWSHPVFHKYDIPITRDLNLFTWVPQHLRRVYSPEWLSAVEEAVKAQVIPLKDNKRLVGYYTDNELEWGDGGAGPSRYFDYLAKDDPNRLEVLKVIQSLWPTVDDFNRDWKVQLKTWDELNEWQALPHEQAQAYSRLGSAWLLHLSRDYFRITTELVRKYDPNHLVMGVRFRGQAPREVVRASREYTDVQSLNYYVSDARFDAEMFRMIYEESGQPLVISEYSFHSLDGRSGNRNTVGFAAQVLDQKARADGYRLFTTRAARVPYVIGVDWFQWSDEPPSGRSSDGEDVNFGIVDVDDLPYDIVIDAIRQTTPLLNPAHARSVDDAQTDVWRESFAAKPTMIVPQLSRPINLNAELSDWSASHKLAGVQHSQTVGLDRSNLPLPNVFLGWNDQGLYVAMEIFDTDIDGAAAKGWWWTRDHVEFWISTRPVNPEQNDFDIYSHQFFFVPNAWPGQDGALGTVGQWHRPGDALKDSLIPHPDIRCATRLLPDRYVIEMFIPAKAMHGWDPVNHPTMAFNMYARNFQQATDYFWSAPKEVMTQQRPGTWGTMHLDVTNPANIARGPTTLPGDGEQLR